VVASQSGRTGLLLAILLCLKGDCLPPRVEHTQLAMKGWGMSLGLRRGMTEADVYAILGPPDRVSKTMFTRRSHYVLSGVAVAFRFEFEGVAGEFLPSRLGLVEVSRPSLYKLYTRLLP
jgi:hypothetical protein